METQKQMMDAIIVSYKEAGVVQIENVPNLSK